jgi:hypothetical protein
MKHQQILFNYNITIIIQKLVDFRIEIRKLKIFCKLIKIITIKMRKICKDQYHIMIMNF